MASNEPKLLSLASCLMILTISIACPDVVSRKDWGARSVNKKVPIEKPVRHVIIGHTATAPCVTQTACSAFMRNVQKYHMDKLGMYDISYNFVIGADGKIYEGVGWSQIGIHTLGWNSKSYGIAFAGNYMSVKPSNVMLKAARSLIVCGIKKGFISESRELHGARDATCTKSPGDKLYEIIKEWPMFKGGRLPGYTCS